ncbi:hypothetical protein TRVA0_019S02432 [Trichomonascus vanleenenianus]|uniref:uncharacterized protein n=1 Tax=Trichomonascus vanleenenianus TaxID=2268995 RepID=UPI003ECA129E
MLSMIDQAVETMACYSLQLISAVYSSLPGCEYAGRAVDTVSGITAAVVSVRQVYYIMLSYSDAPPIEPVPCSTSTAVGSTSTAGSSTPTSPPTCKKQASPPVR